MVAYEEIKTTPTFSRQKDNKLLFSDHAHDISISYTSTYTLKYVIKGVKHYHYNNQYYKILENQYVVLNNDCNITTEAEKGTKGLSFFLSAELINEILSYHTNALSAIDFFETIHKNPKCEVLYLLGRIAHLHEKEPLVLKQQLEPLFIKISELVVLKQTRLNSSFLKLNIAKQCTKKELYKYVTRAEEYILDNLEEKLSLASISKEVGVSMYYLHRVFSEIYGSSPLNYLTKARLAKAKNKLQNPKVPIHQIAIECGFDNTHYFSNVFKKHLGVSPLGYRRKI